MILDTNALLAMSREEGGIEIVVQELVQPYLWVPVLAEYHDGLIHSRHQKALEVWLDPLKSSWPVVILDVMTVHFYAEIRNQLKKKGNMIPVNDLWIGALALQHRLPILSGDRHCDCIDGVERIGWK